MRQEVLKIERDDRELLLHPFDQDKEVTITIEHNETCTIYLSPNECNQVITKLAKYLQHINEPVELLEGHE